MIEEEEIAVRESLPERIFYTLSDIGSAWNVDVSEIAQWLMHGELRAHVWLPMMSVYEICEEAEGARLVMTRSLRHFEGYAPVFAHHCRSLLKRERIQLREFAKREGDGRYRLPDSAEDIPLCVSDLVILKEERARFEKRHSITSPSPQIDQDFRTVTVAGREHCFGEIQGAILRLLYEAAQSGDSWCNGKQLLREAGSESYSISNIFKRNPVWRQLIKSDGRGRYRASDELLKSIR